MICTQTNVKGTRYGFSFSLNWLELDAQCSDNGPVKFSERRSIILILKTFPWNFSAAPFWALEPPLTPIFFFCTAQIFKPENKTIVTHGRWRTRWWRRRRRVLDDLDKQKKQKSVSTARQETHWDTHKHTRSNLIKTSADKADRGDSWQVTEPNRNIPELISQWRRRRCQPVLQQRLLPHRVTDCWLQGFCL